MFGLRFVRVVLLHFFVLNLRCCAKKKHTHNNEHERKKNKINWNEYYWPLDTRRSQFTRKFEWLNDSQNQDIVPKMARIRSSHKSNNNNNNKNSAKVAAATATATAASPTTATAPYKNQHKIKRLNRYCLNGKILQSNSKRFMCAHHSSHPVLPKQRWFILKLL